jgi:hypothetical protein
MGLIQTLRILSGCFQDRSQWSEKPLNILFEIAKDLYILGSLWVFVETIDVPFCQNSIALHIYNNSYICAVFATMIHHVYVMILPPELQNPQSKLLWLP